MMIERTDDFRDQRVSGAAERFKVELNMVVSAKSPKPQSLLIDCECLVPVMTTARACILMGGRHWEVVFAAKIKAGMHLTGKSPP